MAKDLGLTASEFSLLLFPRFSSLSAHQQATIRSAIARGAPAAQMSDADAIGQLTKQARIRVSAWTLGASLAALAALGTMLGAASSRPARRSIAAATPSISVYRRVVVQWLSIPLLALPAAAALGYLSAWIRGVYNGVGFGWLALLPGAGALLGLIVAGCVTSRPPGEAEPE